MQTKLHVGSILLMGLVLSTIACSRPNKSSTTSVIRFEAPKQNKLNALGLPIPVGKTPCFGVSLTASDIPGTAASTCSPQTGLVAGFVKAGDPLSLTVNYGSNRKIDLYMVLLDNANDPCPVMPTVINGTKLKQIYHAGSTPLFNVDSPETNVILELNYTGAALAASYPVQCSSGISTASNPHNFKVSVGGGTATGTGIILKARIGQYTPELTGTNLKLKVK